MENIKKIFRSVFLNLIGDSKQENWSKCYFDSLALQL